jgi:hypothetical protein
VERFEVGWNTLSGIPITAKNALTDFSVTTNKKVTVLHFF